MKLSSLKTSIKKILEILITKLYKLKLINTLSNNEKNDIEIVQSIFYITTINLEELYLELKKTDSEKYILYILDGKDTLEVTKELSLEFNKKDRIKLNRQIKLFK